LKMFIKCYIKKDKKAQSCLNKMFFTFDLPDFETKRKFGQYALDLLNLVLDLVKIEKNRMQGYLFKCYSIFLQNPKQIEIFFKESSENYSKMLQNSGNNKDLFYQHDFTIFDKNETNMRVAFGKYKTSLN
jgi:hypothetical protein